jgi:NAD(P)-dependent dehydrogenase (short-subunit alcohol dehydrogenase family)
MKIDLTGQNALATGASGGISLAAAHALAAHGAHVIAGAPHSPAEPDALAKEGTVTAFSPEPGRTFRLCRAVRPGRRSRC